MEYISHPWLQDNVIEKRKYIESILKTALSGNTMCVLPTGLGKTAVAVLVAATRLEKYPDKKIMFLAPTRPLVDQHKSTFERTMKLGPELKIITGMDDPSSRMDLYKKNTIIFSTPQTTRNDLKLGFDMKDYVLLVIDECHRAVGDYAYPFIAKMYMDQASNPLILGLTASPGSYKTRIDEIRQKLFIQNIEIRTRDDTDVVPYIQEMKKDYYYVELPIPIKTIRDYLKRMKDDRLKKLYGWNIIHSSNISKSQIIKLQQELSTKSSGFHFAAISVLAEIIKIDHAIMLVETQCLHSLDIYFDKIKKEGDEGKSKAVLRLVKDENFINAARLTKELIKEGKEHPKIEKLKEIISEEVKDSRTGIIIFAQLRDTIEKIMQSLKDVPHAAPVEFIGQAKKKGKGLSQKEQIHVLNEFRMGFYNILIASQVGEEGLDIEEASMVVFYEAVPSAIRRIQRSGRTARSHAGKVAILIAKGTMDEAFHWSGYQKEKKMGRLLEDMKRQNLSRWAK